MVTTFAPQPHGLLKDRTKFRRVIEGDHLGARRTLLHPGQRVHVPVVLVCGINTLVTALPKSVDDPRSELATICARSCGPD